MATQVISVYQLSQNVGTHNAGGTVEGTMTIDVGGKSRGVFIHVASGGTVGTLTVLAPSTDDGSFRAGLGTTSMLIYANTDLFLPLESARFCDNSGIINIHVVAATDSVMHAYRLPADA